MTTKQQELKEKINIEYQLTSFDLSVEEKMVKFAAAPYIKDIALDVKQVLQVKKGMEDELKAFKAKVDEALQNYNEHKNKIDNLIDFVKSKTLTEAEKNLIITNKINDKTGVVETKYDAQLPKGFIYNSGRTTITYDETKIPDEYFVLTKTLDKKLVDEHIIKGILPWDVRIIKQGEPSITLREDYIKVEE